MNYSQSVRVDEHLETLKLVHGLAYSAQVSTLYNLMLLAEGRVSVENQTQLLVSAVLAFGFTFPKDLPRFEGLKKDALALMRAARG
jgi:hypothetical protein